MLGGHAHRIFTIVSAYTSSIFYRLEFQPPCIPRQGGWLIELLKGESGIKSLFLN